MRILIGSIGLKLHGDTSPWQYLRVIYYMYIYTYIHIFIYMYTDIYTYHICVYMDCLFSSKLWRIPQMMDISTLVRVPELYSTDGLGIQFQDGSDEESAT